MTREEKKERIAVLSTHISEALTERWQLRKDVESLEEKDARAEYLTSMMILYLSLRNADNRQLAWLLMSCPAYTEGARLNTDVIAEAVHRLYPEYRDNDAISWEEYGWSTPEGQVRYV